MGRMQFMEEAQQAPPFGMIDIEAGQGGEVDGHDFGVPGQARGPSQQVGSSQGAGLAIVEHFERVRCQGGYGAAGHHQRELSRGGRAHCRAPASALAAFTQRSRALRGSSQ